MLRILVEGILNVIMTDAIMPTLPRFRLKPYMNRLLVPRGSNSIQYQYVEKGSRLRAFYRVTVFYLFPIC